jgi:phenylacetate-CoA ligase
VSKEPDDAERYPTLTDAGRQMLRRLVEHDAAPIFRNQSGNRLLAEDLPALNEFERDVLASPLEWSPGATPRWLMDVLARAHAEIPYYRSLGPAPQRFEDVIPISRADLAADIARFVPDHVPVDRLINFQTTGTTGHPLLVPSHPVVAARYIAFHKRALNRFGVKLSHGAGQVGVILLGCQRRCFTYVSVTPTMDESGFAKINLDPGDWRDPDDRARYINAMDPEMIAGDPISFQALLDLPVTVRPRALLSVAMMLADGLHKRLQERFGCPVLDIYSMNEVGPIGVYDAQAGGHVLLQPRLYVEILDASGQPVPMGERGEICVSGGFNFCLPLIRYRTGDTAALSTYRGELVLVDLSARRPIRFRTDSGAWLNNIDVSHALKHLPLARFGLHQGADGALTLKLPPDGAPHAGTALAALQELFGASRIALASITTDDKILQYETELPGGLVE